jgi:hypothetical protein
MLLAHYLYPDRLDSTESYLVIEQRIDLICPTVSARSGICFE